MRDPVDRRLLVSDVRGLSRLTLHGARMVTDVVEEVHATILATIGLPLKPFLSSRRDERGLRTGSIPGLVYRGIHVGYSVAEAGLVAGLGLLAATAADTSSSLPAPIRERERLHAILNGVWGDHLTRSRNPLAIEMSFRVDGLRVALEHVPAESALRAAFPRPGRKLLILCHGLCMNDLGWCHAGRDGVRHDHGAALARDLGYTPLYLHYNSGQHVSTNGKRLAALLELLVAEWPEPVEEIVILGHSMGGLVARSAAYYGTEEGHAWRSRLRKIVFLGTPHHGSGLERLGNWVGAQLDRTPYSAPFLRFGASRSAGITDLRHGNLLDGDWEGLERSLHPHDTRCPVPLPDDVTCYAAAVTMGMRTGDAKDRLFGDGLVPLQSGLGMHPDPERRLDFAETRTWTGYGMRHLDLLSSPEVYRKLREWLAD